MEEILEVDDIARKLKICRATVLRWCREGLMPAAKIGKEWRIDARDFEEWFRQRKNQAPK